MVSARRKKQAKRTLLSPIEIDDFDQAVIIGDIVNCRQQNVVVKKSTVDREFTVNRSSKNLAANEIALTVQTKGASRKKLRGKWPTLLTRSRIDFRKQS